MWCACRCGPIGWNWCHCTLTAFEENKFIFITILLRKCLRIDWTQPHTATATNKIECVRVIKFQFISLNLSCLGWGTGAAEWLSWCKGWRELLQFMAKFLVLQVVREKANYSRHFLLFWFPVKLANNNEKYNSRSRMNSLKLCLEPNLVEFLLNCLHIRGHFT